MLCKRCVCVCEGAGVNAKGSDSALPRVTCQNSVSCFCFSAQILATDRWILATDRWILATEAKFWPRSGNFGHGEPNFGHREANFGHGAEKKQTMFSALRAIMASMERRKKAGHVFSHCARMPYECFMNDSLNDV